MTTTPGSGSASPSSDPYSLEGRVVLVTGALGGIGRAVTAAIRARGGRVIGADLRPGSDHQFDVGDEAGWRRAADAIETADARLDGLVNNAGLCLLGDVEETDWESWRRVQSANLDGVFLGAKHMTPLLRRARDPGGAIVNLSSISGVVAGRNLAAYNAAKGGVRLLTKSVALHGATFEPPVRCNSVHPTFVDTEMLDAILPGARTDPALRAKLTRGVPLGRIAQPEEVAHAVVYLLSPAAQFMTGSELILDGGLSAQ